MASFLPLEFNVVFALGTEHEQPAWKEIEKEKLKANSMQPFAIAFTAHYDAFKCEKEKTASQYTIHQSCISKSFCIIWQH